MSAKKNQAGQAGGATPDPAAVVLLVQEVRRLLRFHRDMGLDHYPATDPLRSFLAPRHVNRPAADGRPGSRRPETTVARRPARTLPPPDIALGEVRDGVRACSLCDLAGQSPERVAGAGADAPRLLVVGDWAMHGAGAASGVFGPGEDEMLARMMAAIGLAEGDYHVTNVLKCCPADGQPPPDAAATCRSWLEREIAILRPQLVCAMGELAARVLTGSRQPLARLHGRLHGCGCVPDRTLQVIPTYHPRLLLRQQELKRVAWQDLQKVGRYLARVGQRTGSRDQ